MFWFLSFIGRMWIVFSCVKCCVVWCDVMLSRLVLFSSVRLRIDEFDLM